MRIRSKSHAARWLGNSLRVLLILAAGIAQGQFIAFNDHAPGVIGVTTSSNATTWNILGNAPGSTGALKDITSGAALPATVTITRSGTVNASSSAANPYPGTPLYNTFNGYVDFQGAGDADAAVQVTGTATVTYTFTGLNTNRSYSFKGGAVRGGSGGTYPQRWSIFELDGTRAFTDAHTAGGYTNGLAANQVAINTGVNTNGDMADWEGIVPGTNGSFAVTTTQYTGPIPTGGTANGPYCYALSGFRLQEYNGPTIVSAASVGDNAIQVVYSIPVQPASATALTNYTLTNSSGAVAVLGAAFVNDNQTVQLTTTSQMPYSTNWLTVNRVVDAATGVNAIATNSQVVFTNIPFTAGYIKRQLYLNITNNGLAALTNSSKYPNNPDQVDYPPSMGWPVENIANTYGGRFSGFLVPPVSGAYYFAIRSDDNSQLFLSLDSVPGHKMLLASEFSCCEAFDAHTNGPILLQAGQRYYIEGVMKENSGSDYFYVAWKMPTNMVWTVIPGTCLGNYLPASSVSLTILKQPTNTTAMAGQAATFAVSATGSSSITTNLSYQWQLNGFDLPGATAASYITPALHQGDSGGVYRVLVSVPGKAQFSSNAVLTVVPDTVPPTVTRAFNLGPTNIQLIYSEPVEPASATNRANYALSAGLVIANISLDALNLTATLTPTAPLVYGSNYSLIINSVRDQAATPNAIAPNTLVSFVAEPFASQDVGNPSLASTTTYVSNGLDVIAAAADIGGLADQFSFNYQIRAGDFDVSVRLAGLGLSDLWAKAELMARETLDPGSRFASVFTTPSMNGCFFAWRDPAYNAAVSVGNFPANYPNSWLRLKRAGNLFTGFASYDGQTWTPLGSNTMAMATQLYVGLAVTSRNGTQSTTAQFRDEADVTTNSVVGVIPNSHEPLGPSSRKSPIAISEIMYKPAPRADGLNLEYLELYNSNPWSQDISGYQVIADNLSYTFPPGTTIPGGTFLVLAAAPADMQAVYGLANVMGPYTGSLKKSGTIQLLDEVGAVLLTVPYSNVPPWPVAPDGTGHSLVLANPSYGEGNARAWDISDVVGGSPGVMECFRPSPLRNVVINEFLAHTDPPDYDYIELYNHANQPVDLSGCTLSDDPNTNKFIIPPGTIIPARGFVFFSETNMNFQLAAAGESIYFKDPTQTRVLDAVSFGGQQNGVATGRWPDGADAFYRLSAKTPSAPNAPILLSDIVINELMYDPISGNDDDQYIELYNRGTNTVDLTDWTLSDAVSFTFPQRTLLAPDGYLVVARNAARLLTNYPNLTAANTLGNFSGKLSHNGEHLALNLPHYQTVTNNGVLVTNVQMYIIVNDLTYGTGGRWGQWSSGGGSSLELRDPNANNRLAANWGDSDETQKSSWVNIENTGVLDNGKNYDAWMDYAQVGLLDVGECLVDNLEVYAAGNTTNYVANPDFESGVTNWVFEGDQIRSSLENEGYASAHSLHIRCSDRVWTGDNSCEVALLTNSLAAGQTATMRFKARWLRGWPEVLFRLNGNWLEATGPLPVPANLGTPGARNSRYVTNAGPAIYQVTHTPSVPASNQAVVVTARLHDPNGLQTFTLNYRRDPATAYTTVPMTDDGTGGDAIAGDGLFSATIPAPNTNKLVAFYLSASDNLGTTSRFPALRTDNYPAPPECIVMFGDNNLGGSFGVYHLWITQTNATLWSQLSDLSNESWDCTIVNNNRVIYNAQARFAGSPYHQGFNTPYGNPCHYKWIFPDDDAFLGATSFNKIHDPGNGAGDDESLQREQCANTFLRALGVPWLNRRFVAVYVNGNRRSVLMEDAQTPDGDIVKEHFPNDADGFLYKMQPWFEFGPAPKGISIPYANESWCNVMPYTTTGGVKKPARYRYSFEIRRTPDSANNFTNVFAMIDAASSYRSPNYVANMQNLADMENWMRVFAANHAAGNWDSFGAKNGQNLYGYIGAATAKYSLMMFDFNICLGNGGSWDPGQNLFFVNTQDPNMGNIYTNATFRRMYWRALQELVNGPLNLTNSGPMLDAKYGAFVLNGLSAEDPNTNLKPWLSQAQTSISSQIAAANATRFTLSPSVVVSNDVGVLTGLAPFVVQTVWVNGVAWPLTWTTPTNWTAVVVLKPGLNTLNVFGVDRHGQAVPGASGVVGVTYNGTVPSPVGQIVFNEIMYNPRLPNAGYVELFNTSTTAAFDLSGWQLQGLGYSFPAGSVLNPNAFLVLAANNVAFAGAYGGAVPVFDTFSGALSPAGGTLALIQPGGTTNAVVAQVRYGSQPPWPAGANTGGVALELIDPRQDNWRVGNWAGASSSPATTNSVLATLPLFPPLWLNELQADNQTSITNSAGQHTAWLELYNPTTNTVSLTGLYLANNYANLTNWAFPTGAAINPGQFKIIFADGQTNLSTTNELHAGFTLSGGGGSLALSRLYNGQPQVLDYLDYTNLGPNHSYGSFPDGQSFLRQEFVHATPGAPNDGTTFPSAIAYSVPGSIYTQDFNALPDPGSASVNTANPVTINGTTYSLPNPFDFAFPSVASGNSGGLGLPLLAGWYGLADPSASVGTRFGATDGDQTTGGQISFGSPNSSNRALGLLATSTTGFTAFGAKFINKSSSILKYISLQFTGEIWRQSDKAKTLAFYYLIDPTGTNAFSVNQTASLPALNVAFTTVPAAVGGVAVDGTSPVNQTNLALINQVITNWPPGAALWLVWEMADPSGKAQGLAIDNLSFSALPVLNTPPVLAPISNQSLILGQTLSFSPSVTDTDLPPQTFTFTLGPGAPADAYVDSATGQFLWTPTVAPGTNLLALMVSDSGIPSLSATQTFLVTVYPPPTLQTPRLSGTQFTFSWPTLAGENYVVEYKNDLSDPAWLPLSIPFAGTGAPFSFTNVLGAAPRRFFRLSVLPLGLSSLPSPPPPLLGATLQGNQFVIYWPTLAGERFQVEYKTNLDATAWTALGEPLNATGDPLTFTNSLDAAPQQFFRVRVAQ